MMTPTDDVRIDPEITTLSRRVSRQALLRAGVAAGALMSLGWAGAAAAPLAPAADAPEDPWAAGDCDDPAVGNDATPTAANDTEVVLPFQLLIPAIELHANVEVLEIVDGFLQDPTNGDDAAWYKETARAGHEGNAVFAGHLNWYGMPEAVFFAIDQLELDDEILVRDGGCLEHRYLVEWVELIEVASADMSQITGATEEAMLTLITCGGVWDPAISQYRQRTVVRARLADSSDEGSSADDDLPDGDGTGAPDESPPIQPRDSD